MAEVLNLFDQIENFEEIIKSQDIKLINIVKQELVEAFRTEIQSLTIEKDVLRDEEITLFNESLRLQSEYSSKKIEDDNWVSKYKVSELEYERLRAEADTQVKYHSENMLRKRTEIEELKRKKADLRRKLEDLDKDKESTVRDWKERRKETLKLLLSMKEKAVLAHQTLQEKIATSFDFSELDKLVIQLNERVNSL